MKYIISFNVLSPKTGRISPVKASVEVKDLARKAAVDVAKKYIEDLGIEVVPVPSSVRTIGGPRRPSKLPRL
jgi:hypothetical protein